MECGTKGGTRKRRENKESKKKKEEVRRLKEEKQLGFFMIGTQLPAQMHDRRLRAGQVQTWRSFMPQLQRSQPGNEG